MLSSAPEWSVSKRGKQLEILTGERQNCSSKSWVTHNGKQCNDLLLNLIPQTDGVPFPPPKADCSPDWKIVFEPLPQIQLFNFCCIHMWSGLFPLLWKSDHEIISTFFSFILKDPKVPTLFVWGITVIPSPKLSGNEGPAKLKQCLYIPYSKGFLWAFM